MTPTLQACTHPAQGYNCPDLFMHKILFSQTVKQAHFFLCTSAHTHKQPLQIEFQYNIMCTDMVNIRNHYKHSASFVHQSLVPPKQPPSLLPTLILLHTAAALGSAVSSFSFKSGSFFPRALKYIYPEQPYLRFRLIFPPKK